MCCDQRMQTFPSTILYFLLFVCFQRFCSTLSRGESTFTSETSFEIQSSSYLLVHVTLANSFLYYSILETWFQFCWANPTKRGNIHHWYYSTHNPTLSPWRSINSFSTIRRQWMHFSTHECHSCCRNICPGAPMWFSCKPLDFSVS